MSIAKEGFEALIFFCTRCGAEDWAGNRIPPGGWGLCGDCLAGGTPLAPEPAPEPYELGGAWAGPSWEEP